MHKDNDLLFSGFVGLFNLLLLWPLFFLFHYSKWELFEWPTQHQWTFLLLNGLVGTVLSEVLWLWYINIASYLFIILLLVHSVLFIIEDYRTYSTTF
jgi:solute carrier family 35 protein F5